MASDACSGVHGMAPGTDEWFIRMVFWVMDAFSGSKNHKNIFKNQESCTHVILLAIQAMRRKAEGSAHAERVLCKDWKQSKYCNSWNCICAAEQVISSTLSSKGTNI